MNTNEISGKRQMEFLAGFDYIREAGTAGEEKAAALIQETLRSFGVESRLEEFSFDTFQIKKAKLTITEPYTKEYTVTGYGRCGNTAEDGLDSRLPATWNLLLLIIIIRIKYLLCDGHCCFTSGTAILNNDSNYQIRIIHVGITDKPGMTGTILIKFR